MYYLSNQAGDWITNPSGMLDSGEERGCNGPAKRGYSTQSSYQISSENQKNTQPGKESRAHFSNDSQKIDLRHRVVFRSCVKKNSSFMAFTTEEEEEENAIYLINERTVTDILLKYPLHLKERTKWLK